MSIRTESANSEYLERTSDILNYNSNYSWCGWVYFITVPADWHHVLGIFYLSGDNSDVLGSTIAGNVWELYSYGGSGGEQADTGGAIAAGTWYHVAVVRNGTDMTAYIDGGSTTLNYTHDPSGRTAPNAMEMARWPNGGEYANARFACFKAWTTNLSLDEIKQEMYTVCPRRTTDLYGWWPMFPGSGERTRDYSGNGRDWTEQGTLSDEDPPPVSWGAGVLAVLRGAAAAGVPLTAIMDYYRRLRV